MPEVPRHLKQVLYIMAFENNLLNDELMSNISTVGKRSGVDEFKFIPEKPHFVCKRDLPAP